MNYRQSLQSSKRWVIKVGSSLVTNQGQGLDGERIGDWVEQIIGLRQLGVTEIILVSSGAVAEGMVRLGWTQRPEAVYQLQAVAAVGQMGLIHAYESRFQHHGVHTAQVLLTHDDLANRQRYLNARSTFQELLKLGVVPIVNENDTVAVDEIRFGDNDTLAALVANLLAADALIILTDQPGMYDDNPHRNPQAQLIHEARAGDNRLANIAAKGGAGLLGRGGMITKVKAAAYAARSGATTVIASGKEKNVLARLKTGETLGTLIYPDQEPLAARKQWLAASLQVCGRLILDDGAVRVIKKSGRSLLSVGIVNVTGEFKRGDLVACSNQHGQDVARGLVNYNASEARKLIGKSSDQIQPLLGYVDEPEMIHRDNLVLV